MPKKLHGIRAKAYDVIVVGAGIAGICTALTLAEAGYHVLLLEKKHDVLEGTSNVTPGRMSLGIHYLANYPTAEYNLYKTLEFIKKFKNYFPDCFIRGSVNDNWHFGLYAIVNNSLIPPNQVLDLIGCLKERYREVIRQPEFNFLTEFYGHPYEFYEKLRIDSYDSINFSRISLLLRTKEMLLNWSKFKKILKFKLESKILIDTLNHADVINISDSHQSDKHEVCYLDIYGEKQSASSDFVVICAWQNIEKINECSGIKTSAVTNRIKILVTIQLPEKLFSHPSTFFCIGPFAMFSNMGDGTAKITYAPKTNYFVSTSKSPQENEKRIFNEDEFICDEERKQIGEDIILGISEYMPDIKKAKLLDVKLGVVKQIHQDNKEFFDLNNSTSNHHKRAYSGVEVKNKEKTVINNSAIKLMYAASNADQVLEIINSVYSARMGVCT
ncbi:FAD-dependent oxidoreductase [Okeania sp. SIO2B3]|uniref:FAD-dependent oxidoreductase n=1 Tax=Okeania sp. SIO2B3 TaxID=2607784 RepID=UPI0013BFD5B5|nr:FAD-dependent oxidoreductase [Okeania sp. SIO2B3]NET45479.1 FAD-dependent oxidoreductase [Okeania sp. SIO2B3]